MKALILFGGFGLVCVVLGIILPLIRNDLFLKGFGSMTEKSKNYYNMDAISRLIGIAVTIMGLLLIILGVFLFLFPGAKLITGITIFSLMLLGLFILVAIMNSPVCRNNQQNDGE